MDHVRLLRRESGAFPAGAGPGHSQLVDHDQVQRCRQNPTAVTRQQQSPRSGQSPPGPGFICICIGFIGYNVYNVYRP